MYSTVRDRGLLFAMWRFCSRVSLLSEVPLQIAINRLYAIDALRCMRMLVKRDRRLKVPAAKGVL